jgi:hypothetical protein
MRFVELAVEPIIELASHATATTIILYNCGSWYRRIVLILRFGINKLNIYNILT